MFTEREPDFCDEHEPSVLSMLMKIDRRLAGKCISQMMEMGVYPGQIPVLVLLSRKDGLSQKEIADALRIKAPTVNISIQRLEKAGLLFRKADAKDHRISRIYLTEKGHQAKENGIEKMKANEKILLEGFSTAELCLLERFLEQILHNIDRIQGKNNK